MEFQNKSLITLPRRDDWNEKKKTINEKNKNDKENFGVWQKEKALPNEQKFLKVHEPEMRRQEVGKVG